MRDIDNFGVSAFGFHKTDAAVRVLHAQTGIKKRGRYREISFKI